MPKPTDNPLVTVVPKLTPAQRRTIEKLHPVFGDSIEERIKTIVVQWLTTYENLYDLEEDADED